jgi:hypothetical protein
MSLVKFQFKPGINKEITTLAGKGGWFACNNVRFRSGYPEKLGGWTLDSGSVSSAYKPAAGNYWGVATSLFDWASLSGYNYLGVGTNLKFYVQNGDGGGFNDITPIRAVTAAGAVTFVATNGSKTIKVNNTASGATVNDFVTFSGAVSLGGNITAAILNAEFQIKSIISANQYTIQASVAANSSDTGNGGASTVGTYQLLTGGAYYSYGVGWGAGGWGGSTPGVSGTTGWGQSSSAGISFAYQLRLWSQSNYGQNLVFNARGGGLYYWVVDTTPSIYNRAQQLSPSNTSTQNGVQYWYTDAGTAACPTIANFVLVSDSSRFVIAYGTDNSGDGTQDPMLVSWSDQENITVWLPQPTNQAGNFRLSHGSAILSAIQTRQEILVFTDTAIYVQQYLGPPFVWGFQLMSSNISLIGPNAIAAANNTVFWMGRDKFYYYNGTMQTLPSAMRKYVYENINLAQGFQSFAGVNEAFSEVWWFYCSLNSTTIDSYVIYNYLDQSWSYGSMARSAWTDAHLRLYPMAAGYASDGTDGLLIYHESGVDDGITSPASPINAFVQSSDVDIGDGDKYGFAWRMIPDITFDSSNVSNPAVTMTLWPRQNPGSAYTVNVTQPTVTSAQSYSSTVPFYGTQQFTQQVNIRVRGRQMAFRVSSNTLGVAWQVGVPRVDIRADGARA